MGEFQVRFRQEYSPTFIQNGLNAGPNSQYVAPRDIASHSRSAMRPSFTPLWIPTIPLVARRNLPMVEMQ